VQVAPIKSTLKAPGTKRLKLKRDEPLSNFAFNFKLRRYTPVDDAETAVARAATQPPRVGGRLVRVNFAPARAKDAARKGNAGERPPVPIAPGK